MVMLHIEQRYNHYIEIITSFVLSLSAVGYDKARYLSKGLDKGWHVG